MEKNDVGKNNEVKIFSMILGDIRIAAQVIFYNHPFE